MDIKDDQDRDSVSDPNPTRVKDQDRGTGFLSSYIKDHGVPTADGPKPQEFKSLTEVGKKGSNRNSYILIAVSVLLILGGIIAYINFPGKTPAEQPKPVVAPKEEAKAEEAPKKEEPPPPPAKPEPTRAERIAALEKLYPGAQSDNSLCGKQSYFEGLDAFITAVDEDPDISVEELHPGGATLAGPMVQARYRGAAVSYAQSLQSLPVMGAQKADKCTYEERSLDPTNPVAILDEIFYVFNTSKIPMEAVGLSLDKLRARTIAIAKGFLAQQRAGTTIANCTWYSVADYMNKNLIYRDAIGATAEEWAAINKAGCGG